MALSNAERQRRHRNRLKQAARAGGSLTPQQIAARDAVMAESLYPVPELGTTAREQMPRFMGWDRYEWSTAPAELAEHFGMRAAWEVWRAEQEAVRAQLARTLVAARVTVRLQW
jgi:hypothetical protein